MKIAFLDIETTNLAADVGFILCASFKLSGKKSPIYTTRIDDTPGYGKTSQMYNDTKVVSDIYKWMTETNPDFLVHYNGSMFDLPYINSRLLKIKHKALPPFRSIDHWKTSRYSLKLHSHSLDSLARHLELKEQKTFFDTSVWQRAAYGSKKDMDNIVKHCEIDVRVLEECHDQVVPLLRSLRGIY